MASLAREASRLNSSSPLPQLLSVQSPSLLPSSAADPLLLCLHHHQWMTQIFLPYPLFCFVPAPASAGAPREPTGHSFLGGREVYCKASSVPLLLQVQSHSLIPHSTAVYRTVSLNPSPVGQTDRFSPPDPVSLSQPPTFWELTGHSGQGIS